MPAGRPRKPDDRKILEGDQNCRINRNAPRPPAGGVGPCPDHLDDEGRAYWRRIVPILEAMKVLTAADGDALAILCFNYSTWLKAREEIFQQGMTVPTQHSFKPHPMLAVAARCEVQMGRILGQFGMTPASRSSLSLGAKEEDDDFDKYVKEKHSKKNAAKKALSGNPARAGEVGTD